jgi:hypothetical protein
MGGLVMVYRSLIILLLGVCFTESIAATKCTKNDLSGPVVIDYTFGSGSSYQQGYCGIYTSRPDYQGYCLNTTYVTFFDVIKARTSVKPNCQYQIDLTFSDQIVTFKGKLNRATGNGSGSSLAKAKGFKLSGTHSFVTAIPQ